MIAQEELKEWCEEQGYTYIKQASIFGRYFRVDKDGFANMIMWNLDDDCYYLKWQAWVGNNKELPYWSQKYPVPERKIYLEAETDNVRYCDQFAFLDMVDRIKFSTDRMFKKLKDNINKRFHRLKS